MEIEPSNIDKDTKEKENINQNKRDLDMEKSGTAAKKQKVAVDGGVPLSSFSAVQEDTKATTGPASWARPKLRHINPRRDSIGTIFARIWAIIC